MQPANQSSQPTPLLIVSPKSAKFIKDSDWFGKMDPFVRVKVGNETQKTATAKAQGKTPVWNNTFTFKLTPEQANQQDKTIILIEVFDEDSSTSAEFLGRVSYKLSQVKPKSADLVSLKLLDDKNGQIGTIDVVFEYKPLPEPVEEKKAPVATDQKVNGQDKPHKQMVGSVIVRAGEGKFDVGVPNLQQLTLSFVHNGITNVTGVSETQEKKILFKHNVVFQLFEGEEMNVKCLRNNQEMIGEGQIQISSLLKRDSFHKLIVTLVNGSKKAGELSLEIEFLNYIFENPVRIYPVIEVKKGEIVPKKLRYTNPDSVQKNLRVQTENKQLVAVKTETLIAKPKETVEIKLDVSTLANQKGLEEKCRVDIFVEEMRIIEESLLFKIKSL